MAVRGLLDRRVVSVLMILEDEWQHPLNIHRLARAVELSASHLQHLFKRHVHRSIRDVVLEKRLIAAAAQLASTDERISTICFAVGFTDASNFDHAFKARFGISPRDYRRRAIRTLAAGKTKKTQDQPRKGSNNQVFAAAARRQEP
jgi:transcriptional regulator GlxA family with amidase domain